MEQVKTDAEKQSEFWEWTKRPDVQAKLYPYRDPDQHRRDADRIISERLLGIHRPAVNNNHDHDPDPACLI